MPYDPELIDWFFIMDGDLNIYLIPSRVIAGRIAILLHTYTKYVVGNAAGLMAPPIASRMTPCRTDDAGPGRPGCVR